MLPFLLPKIMTVKIETDSQLVFQSDNKYSHIRQDWLSALTVRSVSTVRTVRIVSKHCKDCEPADNDGFVICFSSVFLFCSIASPGN